MAFGVDDFWPRVRLYRQMGLDPLKWIAGCSLEVEREEVVFPALSRARDELASLGVTVHPQEGPDVFEARGGLQEPLRVLVRPGSTPGARRASRRGNPRRALVAMRVFQKRADSPEAFASAFVGAVKGLPESAGPAAAGSPGGVSLDDPLTVGRLHAVATPHEDAEFTLFDLVETPTGPLAGYTAATCETLQVADATLDPLAEEHAAAALCAALSGLAALGATDNVRVAPILDGPGKKTVDALAANFQAVARREGLTLLDRAPLGTGKLLIGATVLASTDREVPNKRHYVKRGMQVTVTRPFGELAPLATYLSCLSDPDYLAKAGAAGLDLARLSKARDESLRALTRPSLAAGRVVRDFSPPLQQPPELPAHLVATLDIAGRGVFALLDFARRFEVEVKLRAIPLFKPDIAAFATSAFLMDNATASAPGAFAVIAWPSVLDEVERALVDAGERPVRVGEITARGSAGVRVPAEAREVIASKHMLRALAVEGPPAL